MFPLNGLPQFNFYRRLYQVVQTIKINSLGTCEGACSHWFSLYQSLNRTGCRGWTTQDQDRKISSNLFICAFCKMLVSLSPEPDTTPDSWLSEVKRNIPNIHERSLPAEKMERSSCYMHRGGGGGGAVHTFSFNGLHVLKLFFYIYTRLVRNYCFYDISHFRTHIAYWIKTVFT